MAANPHRIHVKENVHMKWLANRSFWGVLLILGGVAILLENLNLFQFRFGGVFWAALFALMGLAFLSVYYENRANWWALIPGIILLTLGAIILLGVLFPGRDEWIGSIFLAGIGLAFLLVYLNNRQHWWAIIPAGVMFTLALVSGVGQHVQGEATGGLFFIGLGLTFGVVGLLPGQADDLRWAFIPGGILLLMGILLVAFSADLFNYIWPVLLILGGLILIFRTLARR
jgi:hypothetical protein